MEATWLNLLQHCGTAAATGCFAASGKQAADRLAGSVLAGKSAPAGTDLMHTCLTATI
jgi:hypothetical protein